MKRFILFCLVWGCIVEAQITVLIPTGEKLSLEESAKYDIILKVPFEEEYEIKLVNENEFQRALVNIRIDGRKVTDGGLILRKGETVLLERFLDSGSLTKGNKFKFIEKTHEIKAARKANEEDGFIVVTVQMEKNQEKLIKYEEMLYHHQWPQFDFKISDSSKYYPLEFKSGYINVSAASFKDGVTTEGSESTQRFQTEQIGELDDRIDTFIIKLVGYYKQEPILLNK